jgi:multiple sugar transport system permease protein
MSKPSAVTARAIHAESPSISRRHRKNVSGLGVVTALFLLAYYIVLFVVPFGTAIWLSFQNWDFIVDPVYVGLRNYQFALEDDYFWQALKVTVIFSVGEIAIAVILALLISLCIAQLGSRIQRVYLGLFYLPVVVPSIVSILLWRWLYLPNGGALNSVLAAFGLPEQPFLNSSSQALWCIIALVVWSRLGGAVIIFFAGINDVPDSLLEAARLDGAGVLRQSWDIILPLLRPILFYEIVVSVIATVQMFEQFYLLTGPGFSTRTLAVYTYELGFRTLNLGYGAAVSIFIFVLLLVATLIQFRRYLGSQQV